MQQHSPGKNTDSAPRAHSIWFTSEGFYSVDLGTDEILYSPLDFEKGKIIKKGSHKVTLAKGAGPRHLAFHPNKRWVYSINELNSTVSSFAIANDNKLIPVNSQSTLPSDYDGKNYPADIRISGDGKFLYATNRGHNSVVIFSINSSTGELSLTGHESTRGDWPRNFSLSPNGKYLLVANQKSNNIISFSRDKHSGLLTLCDSIQTPIPVCILFE